MIVDDSPTNINILANTLKGDYRITTAKSGKTAFERLKKQLPDLILLDVNLPDVDGRELSCRIRNYAQTTTIGVMSGGNSEIGMNLLNFGIADFFFEKPFAISYVCKSLIETYGRHDLSIHQAFDNCNRSQTSRSDDLHPIITKDGGLQRQEAEDETLIVKRSFS